MVNPQDVKKLRDETDAGFGDCKKALEDANGDFEAAKKILREKGLAGVAKRESKTAEEGRVFIASSNSSVTIIELSCNTDFVAKNDDFVNTGNELAKMLNEGKDANADDVKNKVVDLNAKCKENIGIRFAKTLKIEQGDVAGAYIHGDMGSKGGVVVLKGGSPELAKDLAMHVVAFKPQYLSFDTIPKSMIDEQTEIAKKQLLEGGKKLPEDKMEGIVKGKVTKYFAEVCFLDQAFIKDDKKTVKQVLPSGATIKEFVLKEKGL